MMEEAGRWWEQAEADLRSANDNPRTGNYYVASLMSQQAVEKALKRSIPLR